MPTVVFGTLCFFGYFRTSGIYKYVTSAIASGAAFWLLFFPVPSMISVLKSLISSILIFFVVFNSSGLISKIPDAVQQSIRVLSGASFSIYLYNYIFYVGLPSKDNPEIKLIIWSLLVTGFGILLYYLIEKPFAKALSPVLTQNSTLKKKVFALCLLVVICILPFARSICNFGSLLVSPGSFFNRNGVLYIAGNDVDCQETIKPDEKRNSFTVSGKRYELFSKNRILVGDRDMSNSVTVRNVGDTPTTIYLGYAPYTKNRQLIQSRNNPYKNGAIFKIVSAEVNSNKVIVDAVPEWEKGCHLVLNAKEDLSDFPNFSFVNGTISDVKILDNGQAEIVLTAPLKTALKKGTTARVQAPSGAMYLYTNTKRLEPGEEVTLSSQVRKDDDFLLFSPKAFCRGTYYVIPVLLSYSINKDDINKIKITNFTVSY